MSERERRSTAASSSEVRSGSRRSAEASSRSRTRSISSRTWVSTGTAASPASQLQYFSTSPRITASASGSTSRRRARFELTTECRSSMS